MPHPYLLRAKLLALASRLWAGVGLGLSAMGQLYCLGPAQDYWIARAARPKPCGPGRGHPERVDAESPPSAVERELWNQFADRHRF